MYCPALVNKSRAGQGTRVSISRNIIHGTKAAGLVTNSYSYQDKGSISLLLTVGQMSCNVQSLPECVKFSFRQSHSFTKFNKISSFMRMCAPSIPNVCSSSDCASPSNNCCGNQKDKERKKLSEVKGEQQKTRPPETLISFKSEM